jgi:ABC-2 type transport system ATP-binding protein
MTTENPGAPAIAVNDIYHFYGDRIALQEVSFDVRQGEIFALVGPNGAGKTTTIRTICTLSRPSFGDVQVMGRDTIRQAFQVRKLIGVIFQQSTLDRDLSVEDNLRFHAALYGIRGREATRRSGTALDLLGLTERRKTPVRQLSGGLVRRAEVARALVHGPRVLVLDEPTIGLDPHARHGLWADLRALREQAGVTVFFSTHYLDEAEVADRVVIVDEGRVVAAGSPRELKSALAPAQVTLGTVDPDRVLAELRAAGFAARRSGASIVVDAGDPDEAIPRVVAAVRTPLRSVTARQPSLDDVFREVTQTRAGSHDSLTEVAA